MRRLSSSMPVPVWELVMISSGSTLMAVTDDTIVAKFLQVKLREQFPKCDTHILTCDTEGAQIEYL